MILLPDLYKDKKICLIGNGSSLESKNIDFNKYDVTVGINRIYQTNYINSINVLYTSLSRVDWHNVYGMVNKLKLTPIFQLLIACPWSKTRTKNIEYIVQQQGFCDTKKFIYCRNIVRGVKINKRPLTGVAALNHIMLSDAESVDVYGFDFYTKNYVNNLQKYNHSALHDISSNKEFFINLQQKYLDKIIWHKD